MQIITGRICRFLHNPTDQVIGFVLHSGVEVHFAPGHAVCVLALATVNSQVGVTGRIRLGTADEIYVDADCIANLDSKQIINIYDPLTPPSPEVSVAYSSPPSTVAPLAPASEGHSASLVSESTELHSLATRGTVVNEIEQAYDRLHRTQAMLAYLKMIKQDKSMVGQYLDEAKHTYVQALSRYQERDFEEAREFAATSNSLSRLVEILVSRTFHSSISYPKLVPPPPEHASAQDDRETAMHDLDRVERLLARIQWITANGTLPSLDRPQVVKLSSWSEQLCRLAHRLLETGALEDANEFALAAEAAVCSAEHLCKKCCVKQSADLCQAAAPNRSS